MFNLLKIKAFRKQPKHEHDFVYCGHIEKFVPAPHGYLIKTVSVLYTCSICGKTVTVDGNYCGD